MSGYNSAIEQPIWVSKYHLKLLQELSELPQNKRKRRQQLELLIEQAASQAGILALQS